MSNKIQQITIGLVNYRDKLFKRLGMYQGSFSLIVVVFILMLGTAILTISTMIEFFSVLLGFKAPVLEYTYKDSVPIYILVKRSIEDYYFGLFFLAGVSIIFFMIFYHGLRWYVRTNKNRPEYAITYQEVKLLTDIFNGRLDNPNLKSKSKLTKEIKNIERLNKDFEKFLLKYI